MRFKDAFTSNPRRLALLIFLVIGVLILTYYSKAVLGTGVVFTHFYYIPIVLACLWWQKKGLIVPAFLAVVLFLGYYVSPVEVFSCNDLFRAGVFLGTGAVVALLAEQVLQSHRALLETEALYSTIFETSGTGIMIVDEARGIVLVNREFEHLSKSSKEEVQGHMTWTTFFHEEDVKRMIGYHRGRRSDPGSVPRSYESRFLTRNGEVKHVMLTVDIIPGTKQSVISIMDTTDRVMAEMDRAAVQKRLEATLTKVLSGFVPICAQCKKIRSEKGDWIQIESYLSDRSELQFSHGICPECGRVLYGDLMSRKEERPNS